MNIDIQQDYYNHMLFWNRNGKLYRWIFIVGLPLTARRHDSIFVVVDTLTKSAHFIPMRTTYQAPYIARVFISEMVRLHGVLERIIYNEGLMFTG